MNTLTQLTFIVALLLSIVIPFGSFLLSSKNKEKDQRKRYKSAIATNVFFFFSTLILVSVIMLSTTPAFASASKAVTTDSTLSSAIGLGYLAAGLSIGLSCIGGGIAVSSAASAALGAISEDSSLLGKSLIYVGLAEGVCLYGLIISFMILGKL